MNKIYEKTYENIDCSMLDYIKRTNEGYKDFVVINYFGKKIKYSKFLENVELTKQAFILSGIKEHDVVSFLYLCTPEVIYSIYALNEIGAVINFLNPIEIESLKETILEENPKFIVCYDAFFYLIKDFVDKKRVIIANPTDSLSFVARLLNRLKDFSNREGSFFRECKTWKQFINEGIEIQKDFTYEKGYEGVHIGTGGSSGLPKQVQLSAKLLNNIVKQHYIMSCYDAFNISITRGDILLDVIPPHLGYGICNIHLALALGLELAVAPNPNPKEFVKSILQYKPNFILAGPVHWKEYISYDAKDIQNSYIKIAVSGGEKLEKEVEDKTNDILKKCKSSAQVHEGIGLTEIAGVATYNSDPVNAKYTVGRPLPEYKVGIFSINILNEEYEMAGNEISTLFFEKRDDNYEISHTGNVGSEYSGEICYLLPIQVDGYIGKYDSENRILLKKHTDGKVWIHTGDIGYIREDLNLIIIDRIKRVFNRNGFKIYPNALENIAQNSGMIEECVVIPRKSEDISEANIPVMYAVLTKEYAELAEEFINFCKESIVGNNDIAQFVFISQMPRTGAAKKSYKNIIKIDEALLEKSILDKNIYYKFIEPELLQKILSESTD